MSQVEMSKNELNQQNEKPTRIAAVDIFENDDELLIVADVPGVARDALDVRLERGELSLVGDAQTHIYRRTFALPHAIDASRVGAELKHGVLRVTLPKAEAMRTRQVPIKTA